MTHETALKPDVHQNYTLYTSQRTQSVCVIKGSYSMLFREIISGYCELRTEGVNTPCG